LLGSKVYEIENRVQGAVLAFLGIDEPTPEESATVREADLAAFVYESVNSTFADTLELEKSGIQEAAQIYRIALAATSWYRLNVASTDRLVTDGGFYYRLGRIEDRIRELRAIKARGE
jgi:hypothetical protein